MLAREGRAQSRSGRGATRGRSAWLVGLALGCAGCCSGTAIAEDPRATTRTLDTQGATLTRGGQALAITGSTPSASSSSFAFAFVVADTELNPVLLTCTGATLDQRPPGVYPLSTLCTGGLVLQLGCAGDVCQSFTFQAPELHGALTIQKQTGHAFADTAKLDGETADFAAKLDLPTLTASVEHAPQDVKLTLTGVVWQQHVQFALQPMVCGGNE